jgi:hypothetical protein
MLAGAALLSGCANGDFQEVRPSLVRDDIHDWVGRAAIGNRPASEYQLTDDERALRDFAYPLIEPAYDRHRWYSIAGEYGAFDFSHHGTFDPGAYATHLMGDRYRSPAARYARLIDDIRNDTTRLPQFFETAARVLDLDHKRRKSMAFIQLAPSERANALRRMDENAAVVSLVRWSLKQRVESYRFALERLVVYTPSPQAAQCEQALNQLKASIARYRYPAPAWTDEHSLGAPG